MDVAKALGGDVDALDSIVDAFYTGSGATVRRKAKAMRGVSVE